MRSFWRVPDLWAMQNHRPGPTDRVVSHLARRTELLAGAPRAIPAWNWPGMGPEVDSGHEFGNKNNPKISGPERSDYYIIET